MTNSANIRTWIVRILILWYLLWLARLVHESRTRALPDSHDVDCMIATFVAELVANDHER